MTCVYRNCDSVAPPAVEPGCSVGQSPPPHVLPRTPAVPSRTARRSGPLRPSSGPPLPSLNVPRRLGTWMATACHPWRQEAALHVPHGGGAPTVPGPCTRQNELPRSHELLSVRRTARSSDTHRVETGATRSAPPLSAARHEPPINAATAPSIHKRARPDIHNEATLGAIKAHGDTLRDVPAS